MKAPAPEITVHTYVSGDAPEQHRAVALITTVGRDAKGNPKAQLHPVIFRAVDEDTARRNANEWWVSEWAKAQAKRESGRKLGSRQAEEAA